MWVLEVCLGNCMWRASCRGQRPCLRRPLWGQKQHCGWCRTPLSLSGPLLWGRVYHYVILLAAKPAVTGVKRAVWSLWVRSWWPRAAAGAECCSGLTALKSAFSLSIQAGGKGKKAVCLFCGIKGNPAGSNSWLLNPNNLWVNEAERSSVQPCQSPGDTELRAERSTGNLCCGY